MDRDSDAVGHYEPPPVYPWVADRPRTRWGVVAFLLAWIVVACCFIAWWLCAADPERERPADLNRDGTVDPYEFLGITEPMPVLTPVGGAT